MRNKEIKISDPWMFHLQWHLTERCNLRCRHCYMDEELVKDEMNFDTVKDILCQYYELMKEWKIPREKNRISFTGGEPFVRGDLFDILEECSKNHALSRYGLLTNGTFLSEENVSRLRSLKVDYVQVSIDGTEKTNDLIRGKGVFKQSVDGVKRLVEAGIGVSISMTVHKENVKEIPQMIDLTRKLKVTTLGTRRFVPYGRGKAMIELMLSPQEMKELFQYLQETSDLIKDIEVGMGCEDGIGAQDMHYMPNSCLCAYHSLTILPNGTVYPCRRLPVSAGDLRKETLKDIFLYSDVLDKLRNINNIEEKCLSCPFFNECLGGAKCVNYAYWGKLGGADPQCWRIFDKLPDPEREWKIAENRQKTFLYT